MSELAESADYARVIHRVGRASCPYCDSRNLVPYRVYGDAVAGYRVFCGDCRRTFKADEVTGAPVTELAHSDGDRLFHCSHCGRWAADGVSDGYGASEAFSFCPYCGRPVDHDRAWRERTEALSRPALG